MVLHDRCGSSWLLFVLGFFIFCAVGLYRIRLGFDTDLENSISEGDIVAGLDESPINDAVNRCIQLF
ncbi:MAG TPA: hypothetical protein DIT09_13185 [Glutamicibacter sp.]|nr:hypothetical protein [Glutamicibacter sp.]